MYTKQVCTYVKVILTGLPSAPGLVVTPGTDLRSFVFTITPPTPSECVSNYCVSVTSGDGSVAAIIVPANGMETSASHFDLCADAYFFTVTAATTGGNGETGSSVGLSFAGSGM